MTTTSETKTSRSHHVHASHEGDQPMKTTKKSDTKSQSHASDPTTSEGETTMTTKNASTKSVATETATATTTPTSPATPAPPTSTAAYIQACSALLDQFEATFPSTTPLTATDKKRTAKARKGSERYTPHLVALAKQHGVSLASVPLDGIATASTEATQLVPLQKQMQRLNARLSTRMFTMQSESWSGSSKLYSVLKRLSKDDGEIATGLAPVEQYFNYRSPAAKAKHPKTKKGKEALAEQKAEAAATTAPEAETPTAATPVSASPPTVATSPAPANGAAPGNGAVAHS